AAGVSRLYWGAIVESSGNGYGKMLRKEFIKMHGADHYIIGMQAYRGQGGQQGQESWIQAYTDHGYEQIGETSFYLRKPVAGHAAIANVELEQISPEKSSRFDPQQGADSAMKSSTKAVIGELLKQKRWKRVVEILNAQPLKIVKSIAL